MFKYLPSFISRWASWQTASSRLTLWRRYITVDFRKKVGRTDVEKKDGLSQVFYVTGYDINDEIVEMIFYSHEVALRV